MGVRVCLALTVLCAVVGSENYYGRPHGMPEYLRIKTGKYFSTPNKFYRKPPPPFLTKGAFSYTPPPNYMESDEPAPGSLRPKVSTSKRPTNDGLGDDDINNLVKYLSKQDLDKIVEFAGEKYSSPSYEKFSSVNKIPVKETNDVSVYRVPAQEIDADQKFPSNPYVRGNTQQPSYEMEYHDNTKRPADMNSDNSAHFAFKGPFADVYNTNDQNAPMKFYQSSPAQHNFQDFPLDTQETSQFSILNTFIQQELPEAASDKVLTTFTDSKVMQEEQLPKPVNLREEDFEASYTNNVPSVVASNSYKLENFGDLPLMEYNSKRDTVSSYHVPHYSVVSPNGPSSPSDPSPSYKASSPAVNVPAIEPAPPVSAAKEQSDAHLKAVRIWSHRSKGMAYTLHDDGSLSIEKPGRVRPSYGHP